MVVFLLKKYFVVSDFLYHAMKTKMRFRQKNLFLFNDLEL